VHVDEGLANLAEVVFASDSDAVLENLEVPGVGSFGTAEDELDGGIEELESFGPFYTCQWPEDMLGRTSR
jgi:hypothetical protein